jgi:membrane protease YdiL (CAAX protease family)
MVNEHHSRRPVQGMMWDTLVGVVAGLLIALAFVPIAAKPATDQLLGSALVSALVGFHSLRFIFALAVLPILTEIVFREIIMKSLMRRVDRLNAVVIVGSLFAFVWPVFWFWISLALGIVAGLLYYKRRSVVACIAANATVTIFLGAYLLYRSL